MTAGKQKCKILDLPKSPEDDGSLIIHFIEIHLIEQLFYLIALR